MTISQSMRTAFSQGGAWAAKLADYAGTQCARLPLGRTACAAGAVGAAAIAAFCLYQNQRTAGSREQSAASGRWGCNTRVRNAIKICLPSLIVACGMYAWHRHAMNQARLAFSDLPVKLPTAPPTLPVPPPQPALPEVPKKPSNETPDYLLGRPFTRTEMCAVGVAGVTAVAFYGLCMWAQYYMYSQCREMFGSIFDVTVGMHVAQCAKRFWG